MQENTPLSSNLFLSPLKKERKSLWWDPGWYCLLLGGFGYFLYQNIGRKTEEEDE